MTKFTENHKTSIMAYVIIWRGMQKKSKTEIAYRPARVLLQDYTGIPAVADLAAMRDAVKKRVDDLKTIQTGLELAKPMNNEIKSRLYSQKDNEEVVGAFEYGSDLK